LNDASAKSLRFFVDKIVAGFWSKEFSVSITGASKKVLSIVLLGLMAMKSSFSVKVVSVTGIL
jgi:hypothetical protein